jgi:hypothetical protein
LNCKKGENASTSTHIENNLVEKVARIAKESMLVCACPAMS